MRTASHQRFAFLLSFFPLPLTLALPLTPSFAPSTNCRYSSCILPPYLLVLGLGIIAGLLDALEFGEVLLAVRTRKGPAHVASLAYALARYLDVYWPSAYGVYLRCVCCGRCRPFVLGADRHRGRRPAARHGVGKPAVAN